MNKDEFVTKLKEINIIVTDKELTKLEEYYEILKEHNKKINLTRIIEKEDVYLKHFYDSLTLSLLYNFNNPINICDVGSGAGMPGIVLKIFYPNLQMVILDASMKKTNFITTVIEKLDLKNIKAIHQRAEDHAVMNREKYDVVTARAVAPLNILLELCIPLAKTTGCFLAMKGKDLDEVKLSKKALSSLESEIEKIVKIVLPFEESERNLIKIVKKKPTNQKYPRIFSKIKKKPL